MIQGIQISGIPKEKPVAKIIYAKNVELEGMDSKPIMTLCCVFQSGIGFSLFERWVWYLNKLSMREIIVGVWLWLYFLVLWVGMDEK